MAAKTEGGEMPVANIVTQLAAGKGLLFSRRGDVELRGIEHPVRLYKVRWRDNQKVINTDTHYCGA